MWLSAAHGHSGAHLLASVDGGTVVRVSRTAWTDGDDGVQREALRLAATDQAAAARALATAGYDVSLTWGETTAELALPDAFGRLVGEA